MKLNALMVRDVASADETSIDAMQRVLSNLPLPQEYDLGSHTHAVSIHNAQVSSLLEGLCLPMPNAVPWRHSSVTETFCRKLAF